MRLWEHPCVFVFCGHPVPPLVCIAFYFSLGSEGEPTAAPPQYTTKQQTRLCGSAQLGGSHTSPKSSKSSLSQFAGIALISGESLRSVNQHIVHLQIGSQNAHFSIVAPNRGFPKITIVLYHSPFPCFIRPSIYVPINVIGHPPLI